jgi:hypothetical protein
MAAPEGNQNAKGNKGGGRKSAYQELADAQALKEMFFSNHDQEEIEQMIRSGKFSPKARMILNAMEGDTKALIAMFNKVFPNQLDVKLSKTIGEVLDEVENE